MVTSGELTKLLLLGASKLNARLFRQNVGMGWAGAAKVESKGGAVTVTIKNARPLHAGLCKGSSDLIGWTPVEITPSMVGMTVAVFTAVEVKTDDDLRIDQRRFLSALRKMGGIGIVARSGHDLDVVLTNPRDALTVPPPLD